MGIMGRRWRRDGSSIGRVRVLCSGRLMWRRGKGRGAGRRDPLSLVKGKERRTIIDCIEYERMADLGDPVFKQVNKKIMIAAQ